jgi:hypothetical protein
MSVSTSIALPSAYVQGLVLILILSVVLIAVLYFPR